MQFWKGIAIAVVAIAVAGAFVALLGIFSYTETKTFENGAETVNLTGTGQTVFLTYADSNEYVSVDGIPYCPSYSMVKTDSPPLAFSVSPTLINIDIRENRTAVIPVTLIINTATENKEVSFNIIVDADNLYGMGGETARVFLWVSEFLPPSQLDIDSCIANIYIITHA